MPITCRVQSRLLHFIDGELRNDPVYEIQRRLEGVEVDEHLAKQLRGLR